MLKKDSPGLVLGAAEISTAYEIRKSSHTNLPYAVDLTKGRRLVLLYTDLIGSSIEYEDNTDSRVLKTFLVQTLNGVNNYVFAKDDRLLMLSHKNVRDMTFWLKFNTGELITSGYPIYLDLRVQKNISVVEEAIVTGCVCVCVLLQSWILHRKMNGGFRTCVGS